MFPAAFSQAAPEHAAPPIQSTVVDLPLQDGMTQRVLMTGPSNPRATLLLLPGGTGDIGIRRDGTLRHAQNFLLRMRTDWVAHGFAVLVPDTLNHASLRGRRSSPAYGALVDTLAHYAHAQFHAPVFLIGTSQGTIAATNGAARAPAELIAGLVLTETVSLPGHVSTETVFDAQPHNVRVPVLIIANQQDACPVASPLMAAHIAQAMTQAPSVQIRSVSGGPGHPAKPCSSLSAHGYYGMEQSVSALILSWIQEHIR
ncbi:hypothetical protein AD949_05010 [Acetobacter orleanensis]|nr:hypothetical protein AD949_05010 [Acetobacter orleanensis]